MNRILANLLIMLLGITLVSACARSSTTTPSATAAIKLTGTFTATFSPTPTVTPSVTSSPLPSDMAETFILSMDDHGFNHLFAYSPEKIAPVRLTSGAWDDISPAINRDGSKVVFASNRNAYWDLYVLNFVTGQITRLTDSPEFDGSPSWSPDDQWVIYETLGENQMQINILAADNPSQVIQLTNGQNFDQTPAWSPLGREVAFVSNRSGDNEIWVVNLDKPGDGRFINVSQSPQSSDTHPGWSADGSKLAWSEHKDGEPDGIYVWDRTIPNQAAIRIGVGDWPVWNANGSQIATRLREPNQDYLTVYALNGLLALPPIPMGNLSGFNWHWEQYASFQNIFNKQAEVTPAPLWKQLSPVATGSSGQRASIVKLSDLDAPHPYLLDSVSASYLALRQNIIAKTGWDALASLEDAYTPLTASLDPGLGQDWLFTGRAFSINPLTLNAGWMVVTREDITGETYWRIYLKTVAQDGSEGEPLRVAPWDLTSRYSLDPSAYDQGGEYAGSTPGGYWVDFTEEAQRFGWERLPALNNWRTYYKGTRFNEFVLTNGLDWRSAMLQIYPPEIFITPTIVIPPTFTFTPTPRGYRYMTATPTLTPTPTRRPTYTPSE